MSNVWFASYAGERHEDHVPVGIYTSLESFRNSQLKDVPKEEHIYFKLEKETDDHYQWHEVSYSLLLNGKKVEEDDDLTEEQRSQCVMDYNDWESDSTINLYLVKLDVEDPILRT